MQTVVLDTAFGKVTARATSGHHIGLRADIAPIVINGVEYSSAELFVCTVHQREGYGGMYLDGFTTERAVITAQVAGGAEIGVGSHTIMYRADGKQATDAARKAFRKEGLRVLAEFVATDEGKRVMALAEADSARDRFHRATSKLNEAMKVERLARTAYSAAVRAAKKLGATMERREKRDREGCRT